MAENRVGVVSNTVATPATASHISTWSPTMMPPVEASPPRMPPLDVELNKAKLPGPGMNKKTTTATT